MSLRANHLSNDVDAFDIEMVGEIANEIEKAALLELLTERFFRRSRAPVVYPSLTPPLRRPALQHLQLKGRNFGDRFKIPIKGQQTRLMMEGQLRDQQIHGRHRKTRGGTLLTEPAGVPPERGGRGQDPDGIKNRFDKMTLFGGRHAQRFKYHRFAENDTRTFHQRVDLRFDRGRGGETEEINPQRRINQVHESFRSFLSVFQSGKSTDVFPETTFWSNASRLRSARDSRASLRIAGPFFLSPERRRISSDSLSDISTVILILITYYNPIIRQGDCRVP